MLSNPSSGLVLPAQTGLKLQCPFRPTQMLENGNQISSRLSREHLDPSPATPHLGLRNSELPSYRTCFWFLIFVEAVRAQN